MPTPAASPGGATSRSLASACSWTSWTPLASAQSRTAESAGSMSRVGCTTRPRRVSAAGIGDRGRLPSRGMRPRLLAAVLLLALAAPASAQEGRIGPSTGIVNLGRRLLPYGHMATVGNFAAGGAVTPDGRYYWTVSAGSGLNDVRIVSTRTARVVQTIPLPGASGGVVIDPRG